MLLSVAARFGGQVFATYEVREVAFDEPMDPGLFVYEPRPGEQVRPAERAVERLTLAGAAARAPFAVLVPARVPDPDHSPVEVLFHPAQPGGRDPYLTLMYRGGYRLWLHQAATAGRPDGAGWETVERSGRRMAVRKPGPGGERVVVLEHLGTHVEIHSDLDRDRLLDVAASLAPAAGGGSP